MAHPLFVGWVIMGLRLVLVMLLFGFAIGSEVHGSEGSVVWELQSKSSYLPPFLYRIVLPVSVGLSSKSMSMQVHLSRMISPPLLPPHGPKERVPELSPSGQQTHDFDYHGKSPSTGLSPPLPVPLPLNLIPLLPKLQRPVGSLPEDAPLHPKCKQDKHKRVVSLKQEPRTAVPKLSPPPHKGVPPVPPTTHQNASMITSSVAPEPSASPVSVSPPVSHGKSNGSLVAEPPRDAFNHISPTNHSPNKELHEEPKPPDNAAPFTRLPSRKAVLAPAHAPSTPISFHGHHAKKNVNSPAPPPAVPVEFHRHHARKEVSSPVSPPVASVNFHRHHARKEVSSPLGPLSSHYKGPVIAPAPSHIFITHPSWRRQRPHVDPPLQGPFSPIPSPLSPTMNYGASGSLPSVAIPSNPSGREAPGHPPVAHPSVAFPRKPTLPLPSSIRSLPPPPPSHDCAEVTCAEPLTNTLPGSPCGCVWPIQVGLHLNVALYTFFPLVSELAQEIAAGIFMKQSQVRIMGANAASEDQDETIVLIDLVPFGVKFDNTTAFLIFEKFWHKQVTIKPSLFGDYDVLYVRYPGLPPSPPLSPSGISINGGQLTNGNNGRAIHPLGVDVRKRKGLGGGLIVIIVLSSAIALVLGVTVLWLLIFKHGGHTHQPLSTPHALAPLAKPTGAGSMVLGSWASSTSPSFSSSIATYAGSAKTFSTGEIEKATNKFNVSRVLGEGGFGRVYSGVLEDGTKVAVKVLKRDDRQGSREFLAEVEMLSRLHHRNLVKLIGICTDEQSRCLVYELIPNGSVESHLHGAHKETAPLDWNARMKIALGSARGLAYLHEDSSPHVIHRDFKSSNILLEHDFTPKVSDFGLARTALDGGNDHISTRVMGTFGYVAPEYAMTGHLLVKSDVYSYGVVLLELLTGRKPVDMLRPPGQENLVTWARPLLTSKDGLEMIIDPSLGSNFPFDSVAKVAAIASMCVQPEVSHRPFMGEVVQALKLVCNEDDEKQEASGSYSQAELSSAQGIDTRVSNASIQLPETQSFLTADCDSGIEVERALSTSEIFSTTPRITRQDSGHFQRHSSSGPLNRSKNEQLWKGGDSRGSIREHGAAIKSWGGPESEKMWP